VLLCAFNTEVTIRKDRTGWRGSCMRHRDAMLRYHINLADIDAVFFSAVCRELVSVYD